MASIVKRGSGTTEVRFMFGKKRHTLRLGRTSKRAANDYKELIETAIKGQAEESAALQARVEELIRRLDESRLRRLADIGLIELCSANFPKTLEELIDQYVNSRTDVKPATKEVWRQGKLGLMEFFDANKRFSRINKGQASEYRVFLRSKVVGTDCDGNEKTMAEATVKKRLDFARQVFEYAVDHEALTKNPFAKVRAKGGAVAEHAEVTPEMVESVLEQCPNRDWRLITVLCRYAGMRCPSEVLSLRWQDIFWDKDNMLVTSPKTEHHQGHDSRLCPLFAEVREELNAAWEAAHEGAIYVVDPKHRRAAMAASGWRNVNLRTTFQKIVWRSGQQPWPYLFHSMRSSCATDLLDWFPVHKVSRWLGMSINVLNRHYARARESDYRRAARRSAGKAMQARASNPDAIPKTDSEWVQMAIRPRKEWADA